MRTLFSVKKSISETLIVVFNSNANKAFINKNGNLVANLEGYQTLTSSETSVIWVAEEKYNWYTNNDLKILTFICSFAEDNKIKKIVLMGMSGGGYASFRFACLLAKQFNNKNVLKIISIGINARTGIRKDLIKRAGLMAAKVQWRYNAEDLRTFLFISENYQGQICSLDKLDLVFQIDLFKEFLKNVEFHVLYDSLNPYEKIFSEDVITESFIKHPFALGFSHIQGCVKIFQILMTSKFLEKLINSDVQRSGEKVAFN
jgi:hypothetical protein